jgi:hypothetical protein
MRPSTRPTPRTQLSRLPLVRALWWSMAQPRAAAGVPPLAPWQQRARSLSRCGADAADARRARVGSARRGLTRPGRAFSRRAAAEQLSCGSREGGARQQARAGPRGHPAQATPSAHAERAARDAAAQRRGVCSRAATSQAAASRRAAPVRCVHSELARARRVAPLPTRRIAVASRPSIHAVARTRDVALTDLMSVACSSPLA